MPPNTVSVTGASPVARTLPFARPTVTARSFPCQPLRSAFQWRLPSWPLYPYGENPHPLPHPNSRSETEPTKLSQAKLSLSTQMLRREPRDFQGATRAQSYPKLPSCGPLPPSPRSPRVIVLAPHVDGLVHVALGGSLLAGALHPGERPRGAQSGRKLGRRPGRSTLAPASSLPGPGQARLRRRRGRLLAALSHAATLLGRNSRRRPRPPARVGPPHPPPRAGPCRPPGTAPSLVGVARDWLDQGAGPRSPMPAAGLRPRRGNAAADLGPRRSEPAGSCRGERERGLANPSRGSARARRGRALDLGFLFSAPRGLAGEVSALSVKNNPERLAECEQARVT